MPQNKIQFTGNKKGLRQISLDALRRTIYKTVSKRKIEAIVYVLMSDEELIEINKEHLNHDTYTDIITFDLSDSPTASLEAEIYISTERIRENTETFKTAFEQEFVRVCLHGILHCMGLKDKSQAEKKSMREAEDRAVNLYLRLKANK